MTQRTRYLLVVTAILIIALALTGCSTARTQTIDQSRFIVIEPPQSLYNCPQIKRSDIPNPETLTNQQIADFINKYEKKLRTCGINMEKIRDYIEKAKKQYDNSGSNT